MTSVLKPMSDVNIGYLVPIIFVDLYVLWTSMSSIMMSSTQQCKCIFHITLQILAVLDQVSVDTLQPKFSHLNEERSKSEFSIS